MVNGVNSLNGAMQNKQLKSANAEKSPSLETKKTDLNLPEEKSELNIEQVNFTENVEKSETVNNESKMTKFKQAVKTFFSDLGKEASERLKE